MNNAIFTKSHNKTKTLADRVSATDGKHRVVINWDYTKHIEDNHRAAADTLLGNLLKGSEYSIFGGRHRGGYVWVQVRKKRLGC